MLIIIKTVVQNIDIGTSVLTT